VAATLLGAEAPPPRPATAVELLDRLEAAFRARDLPAALSLYRLADEDALRAETYVLGGVFASEEVSLLLQRPSRVRPDATRLGTSGQVFSAREPRARVDQWRFVLEKKEDGWAVVSREQLGDIDGLIHLSLDPQGFRAAGLGLKVEDFELRFREGTLFASPVNLGPTLLVFVGEGEVRVSPGPAAEREELRRFAGAPELRDGVRTAFVRLHPASLPEMLQPARLEPDPDAARRFPAAEKVYREHAHRYFALDAPLPRAPWWLMPGVGDLSVTFETRRHGELTFARSASEPEDLSLFDRAKRRQICLYPSGGREPLYSEDDGRTFDLLHLDLEARFEPDRRFVSGRAALTLRPLQALSTVRFRLDDDFKVESVTSAEDVHHLFFRVRGQNALMVSLGPLAGSLNEMSLTVRYSGTHEPAPVEQEVLQVGPVTVETLPIEREVFIETVDVFTNRTSWYPRPVLDDHATASLRFDVPVGYSVVTGGSRVRATVSGARTEVQYRLDRPAKYITAAVGRFREAGGLDGGAFRLRAFAVARTRDEAAGLLERSSRILAFFSEQFGPCPYPDLDLLLIEGVAPGGHAPPGMMLLQRRPPLARQPLRDDPASFPEEPDFFLAHELAHQWFGQSVSGANYRERWLSEGLAQYAAALWVRRHRGEEAFRGVLGRMARWALRYDEAGAIHLGYRVGHLKGDAQAYRAVVYDKAAYVLHMLRGVVGEAAFTRGLLAYLEAHRYSKAGADDLRRALEAASGRELSEYFRAWVYGTGIAQLAYRSRVEGAPSGYRVALEVEAAGLPGPVPVQVRIVHEKGETTGFVEVSAGATRASLEAPARPRRVQLNADRGLLARVKGG
jgi:hypothetical protein